LVFTVFEPPLSVMCVVSQKTALWQIICISAVFGMRLWQYGDNNNTIIIIKNYEKYLGYKMCLISSKGN
jgi:hypothetical protein